MDAVDLGADLVDYFGDNIDGEPAVKNVEMFYDVTDDGQEARVYVRFDDGTRFNITVRQADV